MFSNAVQNTYTYTLYKTQETKQHINTNKVQGPTY